jgi:hypothetical protein
VIVVIACHPGTRLGLLLGWRPLVWVGRRSYSIYLWHWPIFEVTRPGIDLHLSGPLTTLIRLTLTVVAADASYRLVEQPWRTGQVQRAVQRWWRRGGRPFAASVSGVAVILVVSVVGLLVDAPDPAGTLAAVSTPASRATLPAASPPPLLRSPPRGVRSPLGERSRGVGVTASLGGMIPASFAPRSGPAQPHSVPDPSRANPSAPDLSAPRPLAAPALTGPVLAIGDSVLLGAANDLAAALGPSTVVDAAVGRQVSEGLARLAGYRAAGRLTGLGALVVALGTNGPMTTAECRQFVTLAAGIPRVVFVTVRVPRPWQAVTNASIAECTAGAPGVSAADWYAASGGPGLLGPDQVHETISGRQLYASVVSSTLEG